jgi:hypothetical protein
MHGQSDMQKKPTTIVLIDHSYLHLIGWAEKFANRLGEYQFILVTDKAPSSVKDNLEVINVHDASQKLDLDELQEKFSFSLYRALITERAYFDYSNFTQRECYSRVSLSKIVELISPYVNALDEVIRTRADLVMGYLSDNAVASIAAHIAEYYKRPYAAASPSYWSSDGYFFRDRCDQTSSQVDELYRHYYNNPNLIDRAFLEQFYARKKVVNMHAYSDSIQYRLSMRIRKIVGSMRWHDPFSPVNWLLRRGGRLISVLKMSLFAHELREPLKSARYVLFPLHVMPEAVLLGSTPELADQFSLIKDISMNLPWSVRLCLKKHPAQNKWSGPNFDFYRKLKALKNVDVINERAEISVMLRDPNCVAVATINGTIGLEAAMNRKPVFVFGRAIYGAADCFIKPANFDDFRNELMAISKGCFRFNETAMWAMLAALQAALWRGSDEFAFSRNREEATLRSMSAFETFIRSEAWRKAQIDASEVA